MTGGIAVVSALVWAASGFPETLFIRNGELILQRGPARFGRSHAFPPFTLRALHLAPRTSHLLQDLTAVRQYWVGGAGRLQFTAHGQMFAFGVSLTDHQALEILRELKSRVPLGAPEFGERRDSDPGVPIQRWIVGLMTLFLLTPVAMLPFRILITDRVTCFGVSHAEPSVPIDVRALSPAGAVHLVPVNDFPVQTAESIAQSFRERFRTRVDVQPPMAVPEALFDHYAGQLNANAMVGLLDGRYPSSGEHAVVIALTRTCTSRARDGATRSVTAAAIGWQSCRAHEWTTGVWASCRPVKRDSSSVCERWLGRTSGFSTIGCR